MQFRVIVVLHDPEAQGSAGNKIGLGMFGIAHQLSYSNLIMMGSVHCTYYIVLQWAVPSKLWADF